MPRLAKTRNPGLGRDFYFFGKFHSKILAARSEREHPGSFIIARKGYYYVLKDKTRGNPLGYRVEIWIQEENGEKKFIESPPYDTRQKAQSWLRDALTIAKRTKAQIYHKKIKRVAYGNNTEWKPPFSKPKRKRLGALYRKAFQKFSRENPRGKGVLIYGRVLKVFARKTTGPFKGQEFVHTFKPGAIMVGMPDGSIRIVHP